MHALRTRARATLLLLLAASTGAAVAVTYTACVSDTPATTTTSGDDASASDGTTSGGDDGGGGTTDATGDTFVPPVDAGSCRYAQAVLADHPRHYFRFRFSNPKLDDALPNDGNAATFIKSAKVVAPGAVACDDEGALELHGAGDAVSLDPQASYYEFSGTAPFSIELWFKTATTPGTERYQRLFAREAVDPSNNEYRTGYSMTFDPDGGDGLGFGRYNGSQGGGPDAQDSVGYGPVTPTTTYHHAVASYGGSSQPMTLYVDKNPVGDVPDPKIAIQPNTYLTLIGARATLQGAVGDGDFVGMIDEVAVYDYALTAAQVGTHFDAR